MQLYRTASLLLVACGMALASTDAQRMSDSRTGMERLAVTDSSAPRLDTIVSPPRLHPVANRIAAGLGVGVGLGLVGLKADICFHKAPCSWDFVWGGIAGYWVGAILGPALVPARRCTFSQRLGRALLGGLPGTALSVAVALASEGSKNLDATAATTVVALAPIVGSTIALRGCD